LTNNAKERLSALSDEQKRLLAQRLSRRRPGGAETIRRQPPEGAPFPLSFAQQRFWFLTQIGPHSTAYNISELHRLTGVLDVSALARSLTEIVRRHDVLRTTFELADGLPLQRIGEPVDVPLPLVDLRSVPAADRDAEWRRLAAEEARRPWDLVAGPVFRARLWRLADDDHRLLMLMHHIVGDGWSQGVLVNELAALYDAFSTGRPSPLPDLPIQYADFAVWQREWADGPDFERQLAYWKHSLQEPPVLQLPALRVQPPSARGTHKRFYFSDELTQALRGFCQREGVTLFMAMLAALTVLLSRYSGQDDVVVGSPIANRDRPELEPLIGCFMNPLPIRCHLSGNPTFRALLRRVRESALGAFANQNVPFDVLVRTLHAARDGSNTPLFQVMFLLQNVGLRALRLSDSGLAAPVLTDVGALTLPDDFEYPGDLMYPVALEVIEVGATIGATIEYSDQHAMTLSAFPGHLRTLLRAAIDAPDTPVGELPILTNAERDRVLREWNHERVPIPEGSAPELFDARARQRPDATAVIFGGARLTYGELRRRANALARRLVDAGAGPDRRIGILIDRSADMVVSVVGVMKSGCAYVPLDPSYPVDRLRYIARDAGLSRIVTTRAVAARFPELAEEAGSDAFAWAFVDELAAGPGDDSWTAPAVDPAQLAYVIYTSGTTGRPKGTMVSHASLVNAYRGWEREYGLTSLRVHLQMASLSFDVFSGDLVRALCSGAALAIVPQELLFTPAALHALIEREQVDAAEFVPVVLRELVQHLESTGGLLPSMRLLAAGSDSWFNHEYARLRALCGPGTRVVNSYGLTEATIDSTYFDGADSELPADGLVPLGRAFPNTEILLLDRHLRPVPVGVAAELFVGGGGLARGYLGRPDLTAERFVPHPYSDEPGARLYRTGDLARYLPDGTLELLGRIDQQVKLRGYRIELAEIESALLGIDGVTEAAAMVREDRPGDRRLVAYVVAAPDTAPAQLRQQLRETMPEYMVPSAVVRIEAMPLTPNGKVDRNALPAPEGERQSEEAFVAPQTETEQRLAAIWRDVLRIEQVGANDNFFDLGGHSLLVVQLHARIREALGVELTVLDLFRHPTVASLARHLSAGDRGEAHAGISDARDRARRQRAAAARRRPAVPVRVGRA
jgi:amino acid adenylation domain-containing protein